MVIDNATDSAMFEFGRLFQILVRVLWVVTLPEQCRHFSTSY